MGVYTSAVFFLRIALLVVALGPWATGARAVEDPFTSLSLIKPTAQRDGRPQMAKAFEVPSSNGKTIRLADYRGKVVFLNFWATWCPPCREEMPAMERLYQRYRDRGLVVLAVSVDSDATAIPPFVTQHKFTFPIGQDPKMALADRYGVRALPSSFLVDKRGNLAALAIGPREWDTTPSYAVVESLLK